MIHKLLAAFALLWGSAAGNNYICNEGATSFYIAETISVKDSCCTDSHDLLEMRFGELEKAIEQCASNLALNLAQTEEANCNEARTECTFNYDTFGCTDHMKDLCTQTGGKKAEIDVELTCSSKKIIILNLLHCTGASCGSADLESMYEAIIKMKVGSEASGCSAPTFSNLRIKENPHVKNPTLEAEKQKIIEEEAAKPKEPPIKPGTVIIIIFASLAVAVVIMRVKARRAKKRRKDQKGARHCSWYPHDCRVEATG